VINFLLASAFALTVGQTTAKPVVTFKGLGDLPGGVYESRACSVSGDGKVVVGTSQATYGPEGFVWTEKDGMKSIGAITLGSEARAVSPDGSVVVGWSNDLKGKVGVLWTEKGGLVSLGRAPGAGNSFANAVSMAGHVIVGDCIIPKPSLTFGMGGIIWEKGVGVPTDKPDLTQVELANFTGWTRTGDGGPVFCDLGLPPFEFIQMRPEEGGDMVSWVRYGVGTKALNLRKWFQCPYWDIKCTARGDIALTGVSSNGGVVCGTVTVREYYPASAAFDPIHKFGSGPETVETTSAFCVVGSELRILESGTNSALRKGSAHATAVSATGNTVVGYCRLDSAKWPKVWRVGGEPGEQADPADDPSPPGMKISAAFRIEGPGIFWSVSGDGKVVVGDVGMKLVGAGVGPLQPCFVTDASGLVYVSDYLKRHCPKDFEGWLLESVRSISADGRTIVGWGKNPKGRTEAWIATIGDVNRPVLELLPPGKKPTDGEDDDGV
jgi:uncharacterized membrane protein